MIIVNGSGHGHAIAKRAGTMFNPAVDQCVARVEGGALRGGVIYQGYTGVSIQMHMAGFDPRWADRTMIWAAFDYPFNQLGCGMVFGQVAESNVRALEIELKLGFKIVAKIDRVFPDGACLVIALAREDCRWLNFKPRSLLTGVEK